MKVALIVLFALGMTSCGVVQEISEPLEPIKEVVTPLKEVDKRITGHYNCGEGGPMFKNSEQTPQIISYVIRNRCQYTARLYTYNGKGKIERVREIPGYSSLSDNASVAVGGKLSVKCCPIKTVVNKGCSTRYTILGGA